MEAELLKIQSDLQIQRHTLLFHYILLRFLILYHLHTEQHEAARWLTKETLRTVNRLPADQLILDKIEEIL